MADSATAPAVEPTAEQVDALVAAAADGVACDGLRVERGPDGYALETPDGRRTGLSAAELREGAADHPALVTNWHHWETVPGSDADRAFLRWAERAPVAVPAERSDDGPSGPDDEAPDPNEGAVASVEERYAALADGVTRTWGQVAVTVTLDERGRRAYAARHEADSDEDTAALDAYADPLAARDFVTYDDRGRYRPLKTAPSLPTGWAYPDLDGDALTDLLDVVYPATVANWHLELRGELDVSHYRETAERQSGIYDLIDELPAEAVSWLAQACCADSQCLKRRRWDEDEETPLDAPRGEGEFPCREPCSLVVAAARKFTLLEREESAEHALELTPSERDQLGAIVDAVAEGRADEVREGDFGDPANRWRVRYLRAKRFDDGPLDATGEE